MHKHVKYQAVGATKANTTHEHTRVRLRGAVVLVATSAAGAPGSIPGETQNQLAVSIVVKDGERVATRVLWFTIALTASLPPSGAKNK